MSFPAYPEYKDSGIEWLGAVPQNWTFAPLWSLFRRTKRVGFSDEQLLSVYRNFGVIPKASRDDNFNKTSENLDAYQLVEPGCLAINKMKAWQGSIGISEHRGIVSPAYFVYQPIHIHSPRFLHYLLRSAEYTAACMSLSKGIRVNQWDLDPKHHSRLPVLLPSHPEQAAIATFLDRETAKIDALVAEQEKLIELLKEKRQAVISHAVTKGLDPSAPMKDSGIEWLGEVPAHWRVIPLKYVVQFTSGGTPAKDVPEYWDGDIPWASAKDLKSETLSRTQKAITESAIDDGRAALIESGSVVVVVRGMILARTFPVSLTLRPLAINQDLKALTCASECSASYLSWYLRGTESETISRLDEAGHGTKALRMDAWSSLPVCLPPIDEQQEITLYIKRQTHTLDALGGECSAAISFLKELRTALISAAVTGKIDVRGLVAAKETEAA